MITISTMLQRMTTQDIQAAADKSDRERRANERLEAIEAEKAKKIATAKELNQQEIAALGRPEYQFAKNARAKDDQRCRAIAFQKETEGLNKKSRLRRLLDKWQGYPAAILGGGPSLPADLDRLPYDALFIGVNGHALQMGLTTDITVFLDPLADIPLGENYIRRHGGILVSRQPESDVDLRGLGMWDARFSGQIACWFACYLGCNPVILCGMDIYQNPPPPGQKANSAYKEPLLKHMNEWRQAFKFCPHPERIKAASGPLVDLFGRYQ